MKSFFSNVPRKYIFLIALGLIAHTVYFTFAIARTYKTIVVSTITPREILSSSLPVKLLWQIEIDETVNKAPTIFQGNIIVSTDKAIYAINSATGDIQWRHPTNAYDSSDPIVVGDDLVVYGKDPGPVIALDLATGEMKWEYDYGYGVDGIVFGDDAIYIVTYPSRVSALDPISGQPIWQIDGSQYIQNRGPAIYYYDNKLLVVSIDGYVYLNPGTGEVEKIIDDFNFEPAQIIDNKYYYKSLVLEAGTLRQISKLESPTYKYLGGNGNCNTFVPPYAFGGDNFYAVGRCGGVFALDKNTNQLQWGYREDINSQSPIALYRDRLYVLFDDGELHAVDSQIGAGQGVLKTNRELPGYVQGVEFASWGVIADEEVLIVTFSDGHIWAFCEGSCL